VYVALNSEGAQDGMRMAVHEMRRAETRRNAPNGHMAEGMHAWAHASIVAHNCVCAHVSVAVHIL
jgi:hypothetical protein